MAQNWKLLLIFGLLVSSAVYRVVADEDASEGEAPAASEDASDAEDDEDYSEADRAHLIVRKYFKDELGVQGRNLTVHLEVYNAGAATASDVQLKDAAIPEGLRLIEGTLETALGKIDVGGSVQHSYVVVADKGSFAAEFDSATVTYIAEFDSKDRQTTKSSTPAIYVMTPVEQITRYALIAGSYATLGMASTTAHWRNLAILGAVALIAFTVNTTTKKMTTSKTDRKRAAALKELEKEQ